MMNGGSPRGRDQGRAESLQGYAEALQWIRQYIPHAVETPEQHHLLLDDE